MYHKIVDEDGNIIGVSANDETVEDENWIEITKEEYEEIVKQTEQEEY